jgi:hypothetical protein
MRTVEKRLVEFNLQALYAQLRRDPTPGIFCNNVNKKGCVYFSGESSASECDRQSNRIKCLRPPFIVPTFVDSEL